MTAQIHDTILYDGLGWAICGVRGEGMFEPSKTDFRPVSHNTACKRGYHCIYGVRENRLFLDAVTVDDQTICPDEQKTGKTIAVTEYVKASEVFDVFRYTDLVEIPKQFSQSDEDVLFPQTRQVSIRDMGFTHQPPFSGHLMLGSEFIDELYVHMGFKAPCTFQKVVDLVFDDGLLIGAADRSTEMKEIRTQKGSDSHGGWRDPELWVEGSFSLDY